MLKVQPAEIGPSNRSPDSRQIGCGAQKCFLCQFPECSCISQSKCRWTWYVIRCMCEGQMQMNVIRHQMHVRRANANHWRPFSHGKIRLAQCDDRTGILRDFRSASTYFSGNFEGRTVPTAFRTPFPMSPIRIRWTFESTFWRVIPSLQIHSLLFPAETHPDSPTWHQRICHVLRATAAMRFRWQFRINSLPPSDLSGFRKMGHLIP